MTTTEEFLAKAKEYEKEVQTLIDDAAQSLNSARTTLARLRGLRDVTDEMAAEVEYRVGDNAVVYRGGAVPAAETLGAEPLPTAPSRQPVQKMVMEMLQRAGGSAMAIDHIVNAAKQLHKVDLQPKSVRAALDRLAEKSEIYALDGKRWCIRHAPIIAEAEVVEVVDRATAET